MFKVSKDELGGGGAKNKRMEKIKWTVEAAQNEITLITLQATSVFFSSLVSWPVVEALDYYHDI